MRGLLESEIRTMANMAASAWGKSLDFNVSIAIDDSVPWEPSPTPYFNFDFHLDIREDWRDFEKVSRIEAIHPNVMGGGDLYLAVSTADWTPLTLRLTRGHVIPIRLFERYIAQIDQALRDADVPQQLREFGIGDKELSAATKLKKSAYARVFAVGHELTFCWMVRDTQPTTRGKKHALSFGKQQGEIWCHVDKGLVVCFDGWLENVLDVQDSG